MKAAIAIVAVIIIIAGGAYALVKHNDNKNKAASSAYSTTAPANPTTSTKGAGTVNNAVLITKTASSIGNYLAEPNGSTLYTYGKSSANCTASCLTAWPPYVDKGATTGLPTNVGTTKRADDGALQYTYKGLPLYVFASDSTGQVTGNGVDNFQVAKP